MKKFTTSAIFAMAFIALSGAAFAGTTSQALRSLGGFEANDTIVPTDTVAPEQNDTTPAGLYAQLSDTVLPTDTVAPEKGDTEKSLQLSDTVVPAPTDTVAPEKGDTAQ